MPIVTDNFQRANQTPIAAPWSNFGGPNGLILFKNAFAPPSIHTGGVPEARFGDGAYNPNQSASAVIQSIAPPLSVVNITGCTQSGGNTIYNYTLVSGTPLFVNEDIIITGMQNAANNIQDAKITTLGGGTFTTVNAGITESGSSGSGVASSDSLCGLGVRLTPDGMQGYFALIGTNSSEIGGGGTNPGDGRVYVVELWVIVNGVAIFLAQPAGYPKTVIPDAAGDSYALSATGTTIAIKKNGLTLLTHADASGQLGGYPGIAGQSLSNSASLPGNSGTQWTNWQGSDTIPTVTSGWKTMAADSFSGTGSFALQNPPWATMAQFASVCKLNGAGHVVGNGGFSSAVYTGRTWANDQSSSITIDFATGNTSLDVGVRALTTGATRTAYELQITFTNGFASGGSLLLRVLPAGTTLGTASLATISAGDIFRIEAKGATLNVYQNGILKITTTDSTLTSGSPYFLIQTGSTGITFWSGDEQVGAFGISGNSGAAGATVSFTGTSSGSVTADGAGNYNTGNIGNGNYTLSVSKVGMTFLPSFSNQTVNGANLTGVNFTGSQSYYSVPDCRTYDQFPNNPVNVQGTLTYTVHPSESRTQGAPVDSRTGVPVDSRTAANIPGNSRTPGLYGPGVN